MHLQLTVPRPRSGKTLLGIVTQHEDMVGLRQNSSRKVRPRWARGSRPENAGTRLGQTVYGAGAEATARPTTRPHVALMPIIMRIPA